MDVFLIHKHACIVGVDQFFLFISVCGRRIAPIILLNSKTFRRGTTRYSHPLTTPPLIYPPPHFIILNPRLPPSKSRWGRSEAGGRDGQDGRVQSLHENGSRRSDCLSRNSNSSSSNAKCRSRPRISRPKYVSVQRAELIHLQFILPMLAYLRVLNQHRISYVFKSINFNNKYYLSIYIFYTII